MPVGSNNWIKIDRAKKDEYNPFYEGYLSLVSRDDVIGFIIDQHGRFMDYLKSLEDEDLSFKYDSGKWSRAEVIGHVIDTERVMAYRAMCISKGEKAMLPGFDQDEYMEQSNFKTRSLQSLINEFDLLRRSNIEMFCSWELVQFSQVGNANGSPCSVRAVLSIIAGHLEHHFNILKERYI